MNQEFFRLDDAGYAFIALLNGKRTRLRGLAHRQRALRRRRPDPGRGHPAHRPALHVQPDPGRSSPPTPKNLFGRFHKRRKREIQSAAMGFLFPRFHIWDPDAFLGPLGVAGGLGLFLGRVLLWLVLIGAGVHALLGRAEDLYDSSSGLLSASNLPLLYLSFVFAKAVHEFAHGFACKYLGRREGDAGQVHDIGVMLLILTPAPYVDATSSWAFRSKWRRIVVGAAGVWAELALAAVAAMVWANTGVGHVTHAVAYNLMFVASVSTVLFNGNPLLRYDAYYILCDVMEMPNLATRAQQYVYYLVKRYAWGVQGVRHSAGGAGERCFFVLYWLLSSIYRIFLLSGILLVLAELAFFVGAVMAAISIAIWVVLPVVKLFRYLLSSGELSRVRFWAVASTLMIFGGIAAVLLTIPVPDRFRIEGVAEADDEVGVHAASTGFLRQVLDSNTEVRAGETVVAMLENPSLESDWRALLAREKEILARQRLGEANDPSEAQVAVELLAAVREEMSRVSRLRRDLAVRAERDGLWVAPRLANFLGRYIEHGERLGEVVKPNRIHIRSFPGQDAGVNLMTEAKREIELRVKGRPDLRATGVINAILPAARKELPTPALGFPAGGETPVDVDDPRGATSAEHVFEIKVVLEGERDWHLLPGQVVVIRFATADKPLAYQGWRLLRQLLQRRFHV